MGAILQATSEAIARAGNIIRDGGLVVMPTETVYGLAADATNAHAVARIFATKGRARFNPLIAHVLDADDAARHAALSADAMKLVDSAICDLACAGLSTVALRAPTHPVARALIAAARVPLAAPSANKSGHVSPTLAAHAAADFGDEVDLILDGGPCALGLESTIVGFSDTGPILLRQGALPREEIEAVIGPLKIAGKHDPVAAPGMLARHYAPRAKLRLNAVAAEAGETFLAFGQNAEGALNLSQTGSLTEAAANLFAYLRRLDDAGVTAIAVAPIPETGLGAAINDRLSRAAEGR
jgi:L-threonylcarbamoyladenylate synthase